MKTCKIQLILISLLLSTACTFEDKDEPHRTYWEKDILNLFEINEQHLYSINGNIFKIYTLDNSEAPQEIGKISRHDDLISMHINGERAILTDKEQINFIVDIIDPVNPSYASLKAYTLFDNFTTQNNYLFHSSYQRGERAIFSTSLEDIANPTVRQTFATERVISMTSNENTLYFCESTPNYVEVSVTTKEGTKVEKRISHYIHKLKALDISDPGSMSILEMENKLDCDDISIYGNTLFDKEARLLKQYDITEFPPVLIGELNI